MLNSGQGSLTWLRSFFFSSSLPGSELVITDFPLQLLGFKLALTVGSFVGLVFFFCFLATTVQLLLEESMEDVQCLIPGCWYFGDLGLQTNPQWGKPIGGGQVCPISDCIQVLVQSPVIVHCFKVALKYSNVFYLIRTSVQFAIWVNLAIKPTEGDTLVVVLKPAFDMGLWCVPLKWIFDPHFVFMSELRVFTPPPPKFFKTLNVPNKIKISMEQKQLSMILWPP